MKRIEEFTTEELADQLLTRFDQAVIIGKRVRTNKIATSFRKAIGDGHACMGLCDDMKISLLNGLWTKSQPMKQEDA